MWLKNYVSALSLGTFIALLSWNVNIPLSLFSYLACHSVQSWAETKKSIEQIQVKSNAIFFFRKYLPRKFFIWSKTHLEALFCDIAEKIRFPFGKLPTLEFRYREFFVH